MTSYDISIYVFSVIIILIGVLWLWISNNSPTPDKKGFGMFLQPKVFFMLLALLYFSLAHFGIFVGLTYSAEYMDKSPCENVVSNSTQVGNVFYYQYQNSCTTINNDATVSLVNVYGWVLFTLGLSLVIALMIMFGKWVQQW